MPVTREHTRERTRRNVAASRRRKRIAAGLPPDPMPRHESAKIARAAQMRQQAERRGRA